MVLYTDKYYAWPSTRLKYLKIFLTTANSPVLTLTFSQFENSWLKPYFCYWMKRIVSFFAFFLGFWSISAAQVGNEWINFGQAYYKIPIAKDGIYKLSQSDLLGAGLPISSIDPKTIQLFHRGVEQAIYIEGEADAQFDTNDFIEFYGQRNDGTQDAELYKPSSLQPHKYQNLYNDTTSYFLTFGSVSGKRIQQFFETNSSSLPVEIFHHEEKLMVRADQYSVGTNYDLEVQNSYFDLGEGWTGIQLNRNQQWDYTLTGVAGGVTTGEAPLLEILLVGRGTMDHRAEIYVGSSLRLLKTIDFSGYGAHTESEELLWSDFDASGSLAIRVRTVGTGGPDRLSASYFKLTYPQTFNQGGQPEKIFRLLPNIAGQSYLEIQNPAAGLRVFDVTNPYSVIQVGTTSTTTLNVVVPSTQFERKLLVTNVVSTPTIKPVSFRPLISRPNQFVIISHALLRQPASGYSDPVKAYADYRASDAGGGFDTLVVNVQQLYDQFNYGETSPLAIFHFMKYLSQTNLPRYLFIIGKGLDLYYNYYRNTTTLTTYKDLVPSSGYPGSDAYYSFGLTGSDEQTVPTGRITAMRADQVAAYLDKVKETESRPFDELNRKDILHLSGGIEEGEPELFRSYLEGFAEIARQYYLGGNIAAIAKHSTDITLINIADEVNKGLNLITFFGHSSATTLDFDIGYVTDPVMGYDNPGKYPMMLMNGCNTGSAFLYYKIVGEDWTLAAHKGATAVIAHSSFGLVPPLRQYSEVFYSVGFGDSTYIVKGIGDIQLETARRYQDSTALTVVSSSMRQQMLLLGDPAVPLFGARKADLEINSNNLSIESFDGSPVTALTDSLAVKIIVRNFGQARPNTMRVEVKRYLNDNTLLVYDSLYPGTLYADTLLLVIRKGREMGGGNNRFEVTIDPDGIISELREDNNTATLGFPIPVNGTKNIYPYNFAIVHDEDVNLSWQTTDLLSDNREFLVEVDTLNTFDSPYKQQFTLTGKVLAKKALSLLTTDSLAYYWRTKLKDPVDGEDQNWTMSSFTYIANSPEGWAQVHFPQYLDNPEEGLVLNDDIRKITFKETVTPVVIKTFGVNNPAYYFDVSVKIDGVEYNLYQQGFGCRDNTLNLIAFDRRSTVPYVGIPFKWYNAAGRYCGREPIVINNFRPNEMVTGNDDDIAAYVNNIALGDSVVLYTIGDAEFTNWPAAAKTKLGELGISAAQIDALLPGEAVVIFGRKGLAPGSATVFRASGPSPDLAQLDVSETITGRFASGVMNTPAIGPAQSWEKFIPSLKEVEAQDLVSFDVYGIKLDGSEQVLFNNLLTEQDLSTVDAKDFPYLKVTYKTADDINLTAAQLNSWIVHFTPVPEGILTKKSVTSSVTVAEGDPFTDTFGFVNISDKTFTDSVLVKVDVFNHEKRIAQTFLLPIKAPLPGDTTTFQINANTLDFGGLNDVTVYANPKIQPERYYDNNVVALHDYLNVEFDRFNPVLDVTVDSRHLINGDFVSSNPLIVVTLWDENTTLLKTTTDGMKLYLTPFCEDEPCPLNPIDLEGPEVDWFPATADADFRIEFRPENLPAGTYVLRVEAADARMNGSEARAYEILFAVSDESEISIAAPYPNPFRDEICFKVVVSGDVLPTSLNLHITDVNGRMVQTITKGESDFHTGTNLIRWDGNSAGGASLSSGMYVYSVIMSVGGAQQRQQGKLVLIR